MQFKSWVLFIFLLTCYSAKAQSSLEVRYLGNMGVAIIHKDSAFLIDGLHDFYETDYLSTDPAAIKDMLQRQKPFKNIVAIAITHKHNDHFDSAVVTDVANVHTSAALFGGKQTKDLLGNSIQLRFAPISDNITVTIRPNLTATLRKIPHINPVRHAAIENYRIEVVWNGFRIIHFGDAAILPAATEGIIKSPDLIIIPQWFLTKEAIPLLEEIKPANIIVTHVAPTGSQIKKPDKLKYPMVSFMVYGDKIYLNSK